MPEKEEKAGKDQAETDQATDGEAVEDGQSRRQFIKKLAYVAPVMQTFMLTDEADAQTAARRRNSRLRRNQVSPQPNAAKDKSPRG